MSWLIGGLCFVAGIWAGVSISSFAYNAQDWKIMKWCETSLGYRPISSVYKIKKTDKIVMALVVNSRDIKEQQE